LRGSIPKFNKRRRFKMARKFIVDGTEYPDPGPDVTPEQFKQMMWVSCRNCLMPT